MTAVEMAEKSRVSVAWTSVWTLSRAARELLKAVTVSVVEELTERALTVN